MALTQRFESYGTQHPRMTFAFGATAGITTVAGMVLAAALTVGLGVSGQDQPVISGAIGSVAAGAPSSDEQAYFAERTLVVRGAEANGSTTAGLASEFGSESGPSEAMGMDPYGGFVEPGPGPLAVSETASVPPPSPESSFGTDADTNAFAGAGVFVGDGTDAGAHEVIEVSSLSLRSSSSWVTPELQAGFVGSSPGALTGPDADTKAFAEAGVLVGDGIEVGAHEAIEVSSLSLRSSSSWVTPELRAGIEG